MLILYKKGKNRLDCLGGKEKDEEREPLVRRNRGGTMVFALCFLELAG